MIFTPLIIGIKYDTSIGWVARKGAAISLRLTQVTTHPIMFIYTAAPNSLVVLISKPRNPWMEISLIES